jgi:hypothetical protein
MRVLRAWFLTIPFLVVCAGTAASHHSFSAVYDDTRLLTLSGVVTQFKFVNPHAMMYMDVTDASGKVSKWTVEFAGRLNLSNVGWTADSIKAGERVTVTGNPTHTGSERIAFKTLVHADGTELLPGGPQRANALEEERRQRALQRNQNQQQQKK